MYLKIEKGFPIPSSIVCNEKVSITLRAIAHRYGMDCTTRKIEDDFYRLWRTK